MIKFKDLYVSLESEEPVQAPVSGPFCGWGGPWPVWPTWPPPNSPFALAQCAQNLPTSYSGPNCWPWPVVGDAELRALKEHLKTTLQAVAPREPKAIDDLGELEQIEQKLNGALAEVRARKAEIRKSQKKAESK